MRKNKKYDDDDGRVIANMNVDGMPWNNGYNRWLGGFHKPKYQKKLEQEARKENNDNGEYANHLENDELHLTKKETRALVLNAVVAVLLIGAVFALAAFLFILFCIYVWFR